jgi:hypothetical protein
MRLRQPVIRTLAGMICGDKNRFPQFPYRTGGSLTDFFMDLGLDYQHRGESRNGWTEDILTELNEEEGVDPEGRGLPSTALIQVVEALLDPVYYQPSTHPYSNDVDHVAAVERVNALLRTQMLEVSEDPFTGVYRLHKTHEDFISTATDPRKTQKCITFCPEVFTVPEHPVERNLVSVMMPFDTSFDKVYETIQLACEHLDLDCKRADNIWINSVVIQDIFELIFCSSVVIADFSNKNPNVFYEVGIAHTLGKHVVPITQNEGDVPFDLRHHRHIKYLSNHEGLTKLEHDLVSRLSYFKSN